MDVLMTDWLVIAGIVLAAASGVPGLWQDRKSGKGDRMATALMVVGALCGITGAALAIAHP
jgi:hypothetical protein